MNRRTWNLAALSCALGLMACGTGASSSGTVHGFELDASDGITLVESDAVSSELFVYLSSRGDFCAKTQAETSLNGSKLLALGLAIVDLNGNAVAPDVAGRYEIEPQFGYAPGAKVVQAVFIDIEPCTKLTSYPAVHGVVDLQHVEVKDGKPVKVRGTFDLRFDGNPEGHLTGSFGVEQCTGGGLVVRHLCG